MDGYQLPFTVVPDQPHSDELLVFDDSVSPTFRQRFLDTFSEFPNVWRPKLGLL